jgi:hypothetical protein
MTDPAGMTTTKGRTAMADLSNTRWEFHRACPAEGLVLGEVEASGAIRNCVIQLVTGEQFPINARYNATTNVITLNDARKPGEKLFVSFYTGFVMSTGDQAPCAMAGTYHEQEIIIEPAEVAAHVAGGATGISLPTAVIHAAWYAIYQGVL